MSRFIRKPFIQSRDPFILVPGGEKTPWPPDGFDPRASRALEFAQDEAARLNHNHVGGMHLLVGVIGAGESVAAGTLSDLGLDLVKMREVMGWTFGMGDTPIGPEDITLIPSAQNIVERAIYEARRMHHPVARTEHLLIALMRYNRIFLTPYVLERLGLDPNEVIRRTLAQLELPPAYGAAEDATPLNGPYERFDERSRRALELTVDEAMSGAKFVGDLQLLLGVARLADVPGDPLGRAFGQLNLTTTDLRAEVEKLNPPRPKTVAPADLTLTAGTKLTIEHALHEAGAVGPVRPEHILLAMFSGPDNMASYVLRQLGVSREQFRAAIGGAQA